MTSPNVQIQNLLRRYVREKEGTVSMNMIIDTLLTPPTPTHINSELSDLHTDLCKLNLSIPFILQTVYLTNFKSTFEYVLECNTQNGDFAKRDPFLSDISENIFEMDDVVQYATMQHKSDFINSPQYNSVDRNICEDEIIQHLGQHGILSNIYGAELVDPKWILYGFIISKIHKTFKRNILVDHIQIKSLHIGKDSGSVQAVLHHLFTASDAFAAMPVKWNWVSTDYDNAFYSTNKPNFIPILRSKTIRDQVVLVINKVAEIAERYNLVIYQIDNNTNLRNQYLFGIIMALRFTDQNSVFLLEIVQESEWSTLEINILGLCGMIFDMVYLTKYNIDRQYSVLVCSDKKKNIGTNALLKKLIKILTDGDSICILNKNIFSQDWLAQIMRLIASPIDAVPFMHIINSISGILHENNMPLIK